mgnify:FL=1
MDITSEQFEANWERIFATNKLTAAEQREADAQRAAWLRDEYYDLDDDTDN